MSSNAGGTEPLLGFVESVIESIKLSVQWEAVAFEYVSFVVVS